jgi:hypothetical protein
MRPGSGMDLVKRMQPGGDLQDGWIMFDHVKRVKKWTIMACHVYDSAYCHVMTIAICDMQSEDAAAQSVLWIWIVIQGVQRLLGGQASGHVYYIQYKPDILDIFSK